MNILRKLIIAAFLLTAPFAANSTPITIDFEDTAEGAFLPTVTSQGFTFTGSENPGGFPLMAVRDSPTETTGSPFIVDNDSRYLVHSDSGQAGFFPVITMTADNGNPFRLLSFDFAEDNVGQPFAERIEVTGFRSDGSIVFAEYFLDGINDGSGGSDDFQTAILMDQFRDLISVQFFGPVPAPGEIDDETKAFSLDNILVTQAPKPVTIDIKPGKEPNAINPSSGQKIAVAVLTMEDFDATQIDPLSVTFGPSGATEFHLASHVKDVDEDGDMDVLFHFDTPETGIACGDTEATLTGLTGSGESIAGTDSIKTVPCR